jgi:hypothetical protein
MRNGAACTRIILGSLCALALLATPQNSFADEGGVSFWLPGQFGSLAATPQAPGWALGTIFYHTSLSAGGNVAAAREFTIGRFPRNVNVNLNLSLQARPDMEFIAPSYTFATPVLGGQLALSLATAFGRSDVGIDGNLTVSAGNLFATRFGSIDDNRWGVADLYPQATIRWNAGVHNYMVYMMGDIPVGTYDPSRLANFGIGHGAIDGGVGYTYLNPASGNEFSVVTGFTGNFKNTDTDYTNGIDWHVDWGASHFMSKQVHVGLVGYFYQQLTADQGAPLILGDNKSRVAGVGPQIGYIFPIGDKQGYLNLKGYKEFAAENRPEGYNIWLTFAISNAASEPASAKPMIRK